MRNVFCSEIGKPEIEKIGRGYSEWESYEEYMVLKNLKLLNGEPKGVAVKCSKRGNDVYFRRLKKKLGFLDSGVSKGLAFFSDSDFKTNDSHPNHVKKIAKTKCLLVTFTFDSKLCGLRDSYNGESLNACLNRLRRHYGRMEWLIFPQPFDDEKGKAYGYCHTHAVLYFPEHEFTVLPIPSVSRKGSKYNRYGIEERDEFRRVADWHSFVDVQAMESMKKTVDYCVNYCRKAVLDNSENKKAVLTNSMLWFFRKTTYSMSHGFRKQFNDLIRTYASLLHVKQLTLDGDVVVVEKKWGFLGIFSWDELNPSHSESKPPWVFVLSNEILRKCIDECKRRLCYVR